MAAVVSAFLFQVCRLGKEVKLSCLGCPECRLRTNPPEVPASIVYGTSFAEGITSDLVRQLCAMAKSEWKMNISCSGQK